MLNLEGPRLKLARAKEHLDLLTGEVDAFLKSKPYTVTVEVDQQQPGMLIRGWVNSTPKPMWGVVAAEIAHQCRSALDQMVFQAAPGRVRKRGRTAFPIRVEERTRDGQGIEIVGIPMVSFLHQKALAVVERAQPYKRTDIPPKFDLLAIMADLDNDDKHSLTTEVSCPGAGLQANLTFDRPVDLAKIRLISIGGGVIRKNGAPIGRIEAETPKGTTVQVQPHVAFQVQFGKGSSASQLPMVELCRDIHARVAQIVDEFQREHP